MIDVRCLTVTIIDNCRLKVNSRLFLNCCVHNVIYKIVAQYNENRKNDENDVVYRGDSCL